MGHRQKMSATLPPKSGSWLPIACAAVMVVGFTLSGTPVSSHECQTDPALGVLNESTGWVYDGGHLDGLLWIYDGDRLATPGGGEFLIDQFAAEIGAATGGYTDFGAKKSPWVKLGSSYWSVDPFGALHQCPYCEGAGQPPVEPPFGVVIPDGRPPTGPPLAGIDPHGPLPSGTSVCFSADLAPSPACERLYYSTRRPSNWVECTN